MGSEMCIRDRNQSQSVIGINIKVMAGIVFSKTIHDAQLLSVVSSLNCSEPLSSNQLTLLEQFATNPSQSPPVESAHDKALLNMTRAASPSPAMITENIVQQCRTAEVSAEGVVEMITWLAVLQMIHRLSSYLQFSGLKTTV